MPSQLRLSGHASSTVAPYAGQSIAEMVLLDCGVRAAAPCPPKGSIRAVHDCR